MAVAVLALVSVSNAAAAERAVTAAERAAVFPDAMRLGAFSGSPPAAPVYRDDRLAGYIFYTRSVVASVGYSGKPLDILAGVDVQGRITGAQLIEHAEPILIIGISDADLARFLGRLQGHDIRLRLEVERSRGSAGEAERRRERGAGREREVDAVAGATVSSVVIADAVLRSARLVAASRGLLGETAARRTEEAFRPATWAELRAEGAISALALSVGEARARLSAAAPSPEAARPAADEPYIELFAALATPARIGRNLVGERLYARSAARLGIGDQLLFVAGRGLHSFKGTSFVRTGLFERLWLMQDGRPIALTVESHTRVEAVALADAPELREIALFVVPAASGFDPDRVWRLELDLVSEPAATPVIAAIEFVAAAAGEAVASVPAAEIPWRQTWREQWADVVFLGAMLVVLTALLVFQDAVARRPRLYLWLRNGFLLVTLGWLGIINGAQLSVVQVLVFVDSLRTGFRWDVFLLDPLAFMLWGYVAVALLFWGRGVFCGWLCPFGALQELTNLAARKLGVPQASILFAVHERLWPIKYLVALGLLGLSLGDLPLAFEASEVEPFKTAIVLRFDRALPFAFYAMSLLVAGLFVMRPFCRYLCPLGATLAIPARLRMFDWLKRRWQCGNPCQSCALSCPVQAIHPEGRINPNECVHCLHCQVVYFDDHTCPPLIERRKRRERLQAAEAAAIAAGKPFVKPSFD